MLDVPDLPREIELQESVVNPSSEMIQAHREIIEKFPSIEQCSCDPAYGVWCAFHTEFDTNMSQGSRDLLPILAERSLKLHEAIQNYLAYPVKGNQEILSCAVGEVDTATRRYFHEREIDHEREMESIRQQRREM